MACACKTAKIINSKYGSKNGKVQKKGVMYFLNILKDILIGRIGMACLLALICICLFPFLIITLFMTQLINGKSRILMPRKMIKNLKKIRGDE